MIKQMKSITKHEGNDKNNILFRLSYNQLNNIKSGQNLRSTIHYSIFYK